MGNIFNKTLQVRLLKSNMIKINPSQPRKYFDTDALEELRESIAEYGIINPITVRKIDNYYQIVAGERRFRSGRMAGLKEFPCIVLTINEENSAIISLIENIQRCDLDFIEEAIAYKKLVDDFGLKQDDIAAKVGKTQSAVANKLRILKLNPLLLTKIRENSLTERHSRALLRIDSDKRLQVLEHIVENHYNVAKTEDYIDKLLLLSEKVTKTQTITRLVRDVRLFANSINKSIRIMQEAGVNAEVSKIQNEDFLTYTIKIPVNKKNVSRET